MSLLVVMTVRQSHHFEAEAGGDGQLQSGLSSGVGRSEEKSGLGWTSIFKNRLEPESDRAGIGPAMSVFFTVVASGGIFCCAES